MILRYFIIFTLSCLALYGFSKISTIVEQKLHEPSGWKTDVFFISTISITLVISGVIFYSAFELGICFITFAH